MARPSGYEKLEREHGLAMSEILLPLLQKHTMEQIADQFGVTEWTIWNWAHMAGLEYKCVWVQADNSDEAKSA